MILGGVCRRTLHQKGEDGSFYNVRVSARGVSSRKGMLCYCVIGFFRLGFLLSCTCYFSLSCCKKKLTSQTTLNCLGCLHMYIKNSHIAISQIQFSKSVVLFTLYPDSFQLLFPSHKTS